jgi:hypothetical protein
MVRCGRVLGAAAAGVLMVPLALLAADPACDAPSDLA